jgi:hypothetical protein
MHRQPIVAAVVWCGACGGAQYPTDTDVDDVSGACGQVTTWDVTVRGKVVDADGAAVEGASVELEDRGWDPGTTLGEATTDVAGEFEFLAEAVTSVEDCWGTILNYVLVAEQGELSGERGLNTPLYNAISDGDLVVDITESPVALEN